MKSIAIWYSPNAGFDAPNDVELHFNLWKLPNHRSYLRFIDIGIKLERTNCINELKIYVPYTLDEGDVTDIVHKFINDTSLVCAIFNENYQVTSLPNSKFYEVKKQNNEFEFDIYQLNATDINLEHKYDGTIIKIKTPNSQRKTYLRIRLGENYCKSLSTIQRPSNSLFQSAFSKTELIDFRVNEARDLDFSLLEEINSHVFFRIKKVHFFFICSSSEDVISSHQPFISCRNLENYRWGRYVGNYSLSKNDTILAYHWRDENKHDFNVMVKTKFEKNNWLTILLYVLILFILTLIFNLVSAKVYDLIK